MTRSGLLLIRLGAGLVGLALIVSLWASPDRSRSLPPLLFAMAGIVLVLGLTSHRLPPLIHRVKPVHVMSFFLGAAFLALATTLFTTRWPTYKLSWLNSIYAALPSIRSLPFSWAADGLQPNQNGGILAVCTAFAAAVALAPPPLSCRRRYRWPAIFLVIIGFVVVFMTGSRASLAGLTIATLLVLLIRTLRYVWIWVAGVGALIVGLFASGQLRNGVDFFLRDESLSTKLVARLDIWSSALRGIQDHLLTGIGLRVFNQVMPTRYPYQTVGLSYPVSQAHNLFLDVALAIGLPGILGLLMLLFGSIILAIDGMKRDVVTQATSIGIFASIVAFLIFGITDSISLSTPTSFIIWVWACALALLQRQPRAPETAAEHAVSVQRTKST
ncbi:MAG: O-antigen ligase family protein [Thermoleophilia bacterium]